MRVSAFLLPVALMLIVFARLGVYPFGDKSLLVVDMNNEYLDYFMQMNKIFREQGSFLRSWDMGMGLGMLGLIAFYTASPLNILLLLFPAEALTEAVLLITLIKFGLCGLSFSFYAAHTFGRRDIPALACSVAYALMGYNVVYSSNLMWLDGVYLLPLVLMGVEKLLAENRIRQLVVSLVFVFFSSYYIGYMVGIFTFLYFTARFFTGDASPRAYLGKLWRLLGGAALSACLCMALLLPTFLGLLNGQDSMFDLSSSDVTLRYPVTGLAVKLLPGVYDTLMDSALPNIFTTTLVLLLAVLFFLNKALPLREKLIWGGLGGFLLLSFSFGVLDLAWHAFEPPTWFPARYSFVFSFLLCYLALSALREPSGLSTPRILAGSGILVALFVEVAVYRYHAVGKASVHLAMILAVTYGVLLLAVRVEPRSRPGLALLALLLCCAEGWFAAATQIDGIHREFIYRARDSYYGYRDTYLPAVQAVEAYDGGVYRLEVIEIRNANGGMALGYRGISHYSSTTDQALNGVLRGLGYNTGTINEVRFARNTPLTNGLLGIRYVLSREEMGAGYRLVEETGGIGVYENALAFPLAFFADGEALTVVPDEEFDPFLLQNEWVHALLPGVLSGDPFQPLELMDEELENLMPQQLESPSVYKRLVTGLPGRLSLTLHNPDRLEGFAFFPVYNRRFASAEASVDGRFAGKELAYRSNTVLSLGAGEYADLSLKLSSDVTYIRDRLFYGLDVALAEQAAAAAREGALSFTRFEDTAVDGVIRAPKEGILATSIPFDSGWTVRIDGKKVPTHRLLGIFLAVELPEGEHAVTMRYSPAGLGAGLAISLLALGAVGGYHILRARNRRREA